MTAKLKQRLLVGVLAGITLWPGVHILLVKRYDVNPWKLGGWGMYSAPQLTPLIRVLGRHEGRTAFSEAGSFPEEASREVERFMRLRRGLRRLVRPDGVARALFEADPRLEELQIIVRQPSLRPRSGMIVADDATYRYSRSDVR